MGDECSWSGCEAEVVAWIDGAAWCGDHALRVLAGDRPAAVILQHPGRAGGRSLLRDLLRYPGRLRRTAGT
jgi:hypothetical protein